MMTSAHVPAENYLDAAREAARWIRSAKREAAHGHLWLPEPDHPEREAPAATTLGIYSGSSGIILFLLQLAAATGDRSALDDARGGADHLAASWRELLAEPPRFGVDNLNLTFYQGLSGVAFALAETWRATNEGRFRDGAIAITDSIVQAARPAGAGVAWTGLPSLMGDGSILLYLLWAARALGEPSYRAIAARAGQRLLEQAEPDPRGGRRWRGFPLERFGAPDGAYAPNFEMGTAGTAYALARLYEETGDVQFLDAAQAGATHIRALAHQDGDTALLLYREPDYTDLYYLGFCHGPTGTARLFYQLFNLTGSAEDREWTERLARGISSSGIPEKQTPGLWYVVCQCCGTAGIVDLFTSLGLAAGRAEYQAFARRVADQLVSQASNLDGLGFRWYQAWTRVKPWDVNAETGYMIGAAGVGSALLHLHLAETGRYSAITFPDNPFPREQPPGT